MDERILVWAQPLDARLTCGFLQEAGFVCVTCATWTDLIQEMRRGVAVAVLAGEMLTPQVIGSLQVVMSEQPRWSDLPLVVVGGEDVIVHSEGVAELGNVAFLQRPLSLDTLRSTLRSALRARRRQYEVRDLLAQKDEAERRKDDFLAMLAHELRNPMAPIRTGLQVLRLSNDPDAITRIHDMMDRQLAHLSRLVHDLLDVSRIARGRIKLNTAPLDLRPCVTMVVNAARAAAAEKALTLEAVLPDQPVIVDADSVRVEQMIGNVVNNAIKFTPANGKVRVELTVDGAEAVIRVHDDGIGIAADQLAHVFDLFAQAPRALDRSQGGLGIGLTVVKLLAELHRGRVEIFSRGEGTGTEAMIRLPLAPTSTFIPKPAEARVAPSAPRRVLVIEDNQDAADMLQAYLTHLGHQVMVAHDGRAGLEMAAQHKPDVIICDIGLPLIDGYEIASRLRGEAGFEGCLLIAMTGYGDVNDRERTRRAGFAHHLTKPADPIKVARLVAAAKVE
ncbi:MAG TPA: ATP-binding protein [Vicinamibacterales bacterium]|nr:ATP-binding protein [Vicinamibacterales bacterium]